MSSDNIGKGSFVVYIEQFVIAGAGLLISALLARSLSTDEFGIYKLVASILTFTSYVTSFGLETTLSRYIPSFVVKESYSLVNKVLGWALAIRGTAIGLLFVIITLFRDEFGSIFNAEPIFGSLYIIVVPYISLTLINGIVGNGLLIGYSQRHVLGYVRIISKLLVVAFVVYLALTGQGLFFAISILLMAAIVEFFIYLWFFTKRYLENKHKFKISENRYLPIKKIRSFSIYNWLFKSGQVFREYSVDQFVISYFLNTTQVAFYGVAIAIPSMMRSFSPGRMLQGVLLPTFVKKFEKKGTIDSVLPGYLLLQKVNLAILMPLGIGFFIFVPEIISIIYSDTYLPAVNSARILIGLGIIQGLADPFYMISQSVEKANLVFYSSFFGFFNLGANLVLVPILGIEGAAIATGSIGILIYIFFLIVYKYFFGIKFPLMVHTIGLIILNFSPSLALLYIAKMSDIFSFLGIICIILSICTYFLSMYYNSIFDNKEWELLNNKLSNKITEKWT